MQLIINVVMTCVVFNIVLMLLVVMYSTPYILWANNQYDKLQKKHIALDIMPTLKNATILYTSPFTGKKPLIF